LLWTHDPFRACLAKQNRGNADENPRLQPTTTFPITKLDITLISVEILALFDCLNLGDVRSLRRFGQPRNNQAQNEVWHEACTCGLLTGDIWIPEALFL
jgi:hypothetical protein